MAVEAATEANRARGAGKVAAAERANAAAQVGASEAEQRVSPPHWSRARRSVLPLALGRQYWAAAGLPPLPCRPCWPAARLAKTGRARAGWVAVELAVEWLAAEEVRAGRARGWRQCAAAPELRGCSHAGHPLTMCHAGHPVGARACSERPRRRTKHSEKGN